MENEEGAESSSEVGATRPAGSRSPQLDFGLKNGMLSFTGQTQGEPGRVTLEIPILLPSDFWSWLSHLPLCDLGRAFDLPCLCLPMSRWESRATA